MTVLGVVGAGRMGAGIAQLGCQAGLETRLLDTEPEALDRARVSVAERTSDEHLTTTTSTADLAGCDVVVEAVFEDLELKRRLLSEVADAVGADAVLATNTSSIPVTQIAAGVPGPERVVGMHFFNPAPVMRLVEVVRGVESSDAAIHAVTQLGEQMGKRVIVAQDGPGFLVNRCNRPFGLEALSCLQEGMADIATIDRIVRLGGGFRMGPFELMDLVGIRTGFEVAKSFYELSFGEPRWRPNVLHAQQAASGRNWYAEPRAEDPPQPEVGGGDGLVVMNVGPGALGPSLWDAAVEAGWEVITPWHAHGRQPALIVDCDAEDDETPMVYGAPHLVLCDSGSLVRLDDGHGSVGFHFLPPVQDTRLVELTATARTPAAFRPAAERFFTTLGKHVAWVGDGPGLVLGRIVAQLVNECAFALSDGIGIAEDIDAGLELGLNHPRGWLEWADDVGDLHVQSVLGALLAERGDPRYRPAPVWARKLTFHDDPTLT